MQILRAIGVALAVTLASAFGDAAIADAQIAQDHPGQYDRMDIENGSRVYATQCAQCHGPTGDTIGGVDLRRGLFRTAVSDEDLVRVITTGVPGAGMPAFKLQPPEMSGIVAFIRAGFDVAGTAVKVGHAGRGAQLFAGKAACATCHRVSGRGPRLAPDLTEIGLVRSPSALQRTLLDPTAAMLPINRPVRVVTRDGRTIKGRRLNEDTYSVQLIDEQERLLSIAKADVTQLEVSTTSPMPSYRERLSTDELADVIAYLLSLKGVQP
jgi:putative heme-binding domain-containing protein